MSEPFRVNVSSVQDFYQCRFRWWCKWVMNRVPRREPAVLTAGKLLHQIFEDHFTEGVPLIDAAARRRREWEQEVLRAQPADRIEGAKALMILTDLEEALPLWRDKYTYEVPVLEVEEPFEWEMPGLPNVVWLGRPDRVGVMEGMVWHRQTKGLHATKNFEVFLRLQNRSYHEHLYAEHLAEKYRQWPYGGTDFNLIRKLKFRTNEGKKNEKTKSATEMFYQRPMSIQMQGNSRSARLHRHVMASMRQHVEQMMQVRNEWLDHEVIPAPNENMNGGFNGGVIDPYFEVLVGARSLDDDKLFKDREDLYAPTAVEE